MQIYTVIVKWILLFLNFNPYRSNVELKSTMLSAIPEPMSSSNRQLFYNAFCWFSLGFCYLVAAFQLWRLEIFWKINLDKTVGTDKNNLDCKGLKLNFNLFKFKRNHSVKMSRIYPQACFVLFWRIFPSALPHSSARKTLVYNDTNYSVLFMTLWLRWTLFLQYVQYTRKKLQNCSDHQFN